MSRESTRFARLGRFMLQAGSPDYFATVGTRIVRGRGFTSKTEPTVRGWPWSARRWPCALAEQDPLGKCSRISRDTMPCTTVVGVAEDIKSRELSGARGFYLLSADGAVHGVVRLRRCWRCFCVFVGVPPTSARRCGRDCSS